MKKQTTPDYQEVKVQLSPILFGQVGVCGDTYTLLWRPDSDEERVLTKDQFEKRFPDAKLLYVK